MTMVSRVLGLVRDVVIARLFGAGEGVDAFFLANKIPNFMRRLFAEGAFNQAFVPVLSEYRTRRSHAEVQDLVNSVTASLGGLLAIVTVLVVVAAPLLAMVVAYGFIDEPYKFDTFVQMFRITFPYLLLISMTAMCGAVLNSYGYFAGPAITPAMLNLSLIGCSFLLAPYLGEPALALAWGVLIAGVAQLLFQLPFLMHIRLLPMPRPRRGHEGVRRIKRLMLPALFGVSVSQINLLLDTVIASLLVTGSVSWLYYSDRLMELPLGTFGIAIAIVVLPSLSRKHASQSMDEFSATLDWAFRLVCLIALPATLALILIAEPLLVTLFQNENFTAFDVERSAASLRAYAIGLAAFMAVKIFAPGFYARQNTSTPVRIGVIAMTVNMVLNVSFYLSGFAHVGLALATSLAAVLNASLLLRGLRRDGVFRFQLGWGRLLLQMLAANAVMVLVLLSLAGQWEEWMEWTIAAKVGQLAVLVLGGLLAYLLSLYVCGLRPRHLLR
ncbi:MAG: murein biosynthesis integral membrane protein MurJ [Gammaproteobacteria bacterium]|nr:murein biosynthesis integral membrane protein MurJ [Gammaproteobacteria bacterium]MYH45796.1 murein biosynthesis integral membrane protein MurJ [Gammaproteobacteria bacterium]MYL12746.1 murein biosynthesis integral membrane protein MurJ [Gammaproteobacteria bacterium]